MATTYVKIASAVASGGSVAEFNLNSIPSTYTDLKLVVSLRNTADAYAARINFNGAGSNFSYRSIYGDGSSAASYSGTNTFMQVQYPAANTYTANTFGNASLYIPNYAGSTNKSISIDSVNENNATTAYIVPMAYLWDNTSVISSIRIYADSSAFAEHSTAYLYGVSNA